MEYEVAIPLAGFEDETEFKLIKSDNFFSSLKSLNSPIELKLMNFDALKKISFELPEKYVDILGITSVRDISIFYIFVLQNPVEKSVMNMFSPLIFNNKNYKMGQVQLETSALGLETIESMIPKF